MVAHLLVCAIDGTVLSVPDCPAVRSRHSKQPGNHGGSGYPRVRLLALVACGDFLTRAKTIRKLPVLARTCRKALIDIAILTGDPLDNPTTGLNFTALALGANGFQEAEHSRGRIVMWRHAAVALVAGVQLPRPLSSLATLGHVDVGADALAGPSILGSALALGFIGVEEGGHIAEVHEQPNLEAWVGDGHMYSSSISGAVDGFRKPRMVLRPLDIKQTPAFVHLRVALVESHGVVHQSVRNSVDIGDLDTESGIVGHLRQVAQTDDIVRL
jgi:hypothetical protein